MQIRPIVILIYIFLCFDCKATWVLYGENINGNQFWYEDTNVRKQGKNIYVWARITTKTKEINQPIPIYYIIDCNEYSVIFLELFLFLETRKNVNELLPPDEFKKNLADTLCK